MGTRPPCIEGLDRCYINSPTGPGPSEVATALRTYTAHSHRFGPRDSRYQRNIGCKSHCSIFGQCSRCPCNTGRTCHCSRFRWMNTSRHSCRAVRHTSGTERYHTDFEQQRFRCSSHWCFSRSRSKRGPQCRTYGTALCRAQHHWYIGLRLMYWDQILARTNGHSPYWASGFGWTKYVSYEAYVQRRRCGRRPVQAERRRMR